MNRKRRKIQRTVRLIVLIIVLILSIRVISFSMSQYSSSLWGPKSNLLIMVEGKDQMLAVVSSAQGKIFIIKINDNTVMDKGPFDAKYNLSSIIRLGEIDQKKEEYIEKALSNFFGVKIDGYLINSNLNFNNFDIKLSDVIIGKTNLTVFDYLKIKSESFGLEKIDLEKEVKNTISKENNDQLLTYKNQDLDEYFSQIFRDKYLSNLKFYVKIRNTNQDSNNITYYQRLVENVGWKLSDVEKADQSKIINKINCRIKKLAVKDNQTISKMFNCDPEVNSTINYDLELIIN
jgi:hypothetical protein